MDGIVTGSGSGTEWRGSRMTMAGVPVLVIGALPTTTAPGLFDALACPVLAGSPVETGSRDGAGFEHPARVAVSTMPAQPSRSRVNNRTTYSPFGPYPYEADWNRASSAETRVIDRHHELYDAAINALRDGRPVDIRQV